MLKKIVFLSVILSLIICPAAFAQRLVGSAYGVVIDDSGAVLPGVTITVTGPNLMGTAVYTTPETGRYRFPTLPPGTYALKAELSGFQTTEITGIIVNAGKATEIDIVMAIAGVEEVITVTGESPVVDLKTSKVAVSMTRDLLNNIPMARDLYDIVNAAPGAVSENVTYRRTSSIHGGTVRGNTYAFDGVNMNDPVVMYPLTNVNFDVMEEVEVVTAGHPAEIGYTSGGYINIVTKSGGNELHGAGNVYFTNESLAQVLFTDAQLDFMGIAAPVYDKSWFDGSFAIGGPIKKDKLWFFGNARFIKQEMFTNFIPYTDGLGVFHDEYGWTHNEKMAFIKVTGQVSEKLRIMGQYNWVIRSRPMYEQSAWNLAFEATRVWDGETGSTINGIVTYVFDPNTFVDFRIGFVRRYFPLPMQAENSDLPWIFNFDTGTLWTTARYNEIYLRQRFQTGGYLTKFVDNVAGGSHEFKLGFEIENAYGDWDWWRTDNMMWYWDSVDEPYYYGDGVGRVHFFVCAANAGDSKIVDKAKRFGFYIQDSATFGRLTINAGLRLDRSNGFKPASNKGQSGNPLSVWVGETVVRPIADFNPFGEMTADAWNDIMIWNSWSPRFALTYDLTGDGKTAIRASFNRYTEYMMLQLFSTVHPFYPKSYRFYWYDDNNDQYPNMGDSFENHPYNDFRGMDSAFVQERLDPSTTGSYMDEVVIGFQRELSRDFSIAVNYLYKHNQNLFEDGRYHLDEGRFWNTYESAPDLWVPFTTIVPGAGDYPEVEVTFYAQTLDAPGNYYRGTNIPDLYRKYQGIEFVFNKRMSNRWQFSGSLVFSKSYGNIGGFYGASWGWSGAGDNPNTYVNADGRLDVDRPILIRLMGTYQLPKGIMLSAFYRFQSGPINVGSGNAQIARSANILPPSDWCAANNALRTYYFVNLELPGIYRQPNESYLDIRLEKQFDLGGGRRLGIYVDAFNVLGYSNIVYEGRDVYIWSPAAENTTEGSMSLRSAYGNPLRAATGSGIRKFNFSFRFTF